MDGRGGAAPHALHGAELVLEPLPSGVLVQGRDLGRPAVGAGGVLRLRWRRRAPRGRTGRTGCLPHRRANVYLPRLRGSRCCDRVGTSSAGSRATTRSSRCGGSSSPTCRPRSRHFCASSATSPASSSSPSTTAVVGGG